MAVARREVLSLYKVLLRESQKFTSYNFREYALRRIRDGFKANKDLGEDIKQMEFSKGVEALQLIQRQVVLNRMYQAPKLVIEK
ncbi:LYR motif-containing protein bcn92 [Oratosquilla oratoria]|uniref:LYR motif-containing protein bcn92 n=1 Tax=Oratosquilla oratoria TaxID=337810 RepID=UPI003F76B0BB